jgi:hypothetical protein
MPTTTISTTSAAKLEPAEYPQDARIDAAQLAPSLDLAAGTLLGKITATNKLAAYNDSLTNGVETAVAILVYDTSTDASGNHYLGDSDVPSEVNLPHKDCSIYVAGVFRTTDLTGYNAAALADFQGRLLPSGFLRIP